MRIKNTFNANSFREMINLGFTSEKWWQLLNIIISRCGLDTVVNSIDRSSCIGNGAVAFATDMVNREDMIAFLEKAEITNSFVTYCNTPYSNWLVVLLHSSEEGENLNITSDDLTEIVLNQLLKNINVRRFTYAENHRISKLKEKIQNKKGTEGTLSPAMEYVLAEIAALVKA
jgi:hypothetical protein